jgi:lambda repressor-like predicted transcriptional regulator
VKSATIASLPEQAEQSLSKVRVKKMLESMLDQLQAMIAQAMGLPVSEVRDHL